MIGRLATLFSAAVAGSMASAQAPPKPLFADQSMLRLTITGPVAQVAQTGGANREPQDAVLTVSGAVPETHAIKLSRADTLLKRGGCQFTPLR